AQHRPEGDVDARDGDESSIRGGHPPRRGFVVDDPQSSVSGDRGSRRRFQPAHVAALLVTGDDGARPHRSNLVGEVSRCFDVGNVLGEEDHAGEVLAQGARHPAGEASAGKAGHEDSVGDAHPFTAPADNPETRLRCTATKKMITGTVMRVEAAMIGPQSALCWPKKRWSPIATVNF